MSKILANGHDAEVFQRKDANAQRWHLYERINDLFIMAETNSIDIKAKFKSHKRCGIFAIGALVLFTLVLTGIVSWEEIKLLILKKAI